MALWNEQNMFRGLRVEIPKREHIVILVDNRAGDLARCDFTENTIFHRKPQ
ncbi:hypothetical protein KDAU_12960 [Dictyobacter aurantiacus]|uniref:Uncharacterized protein n=1 Tax=Dictyobacter aurantiacus TaxID=1936993 RepID=A0A401ZAR9_9CHLR|nr:hypothetical protein KDAU_12960 [Dictyobacter aurantiacus]